MDELKKPARPFFGGRWPIHKQSMDVFFDSAILPLGVLFAVKVHYGNTAVRM